MCIHASITRAGRPIARNSKAYRKLSALSRAGVSRLRRIVPTRVVRVQNTANERGHHFGVLRRSPERQGP